MVHIVKIKKINKPAQVMSDIAFLLLGDVFIISVEAEEGKLTKTAKFNIFFDHKSPYKILMYNKHVLRNYKINDQRVTTVVLKRDNNLSDIDLKAIYLEVEIGIVNT